MGEVKERLKEGHTETNGRMRIDSFHFILVRVSVYVFFVRELL